LRHGESGSKLVVGGFGDTDKGVLMNSFRGHWLGELLITPFVEFDDYEWCRLRYKHLAEDGLQRLFRDDFSVKMPKHYPGVFV